MRFQTGKAAGAIVQPPCLKDHAQALSSDLLDQLCFIPPRVVLADLAIYNACPRHAGILDGLARRRKMQPCAGMCSLG